MKNMVIEMLTLYGGNREKVVEQLNELGLVEQLSERSTSASDQRDLDYFDEELQAQAEAERAEAEAAALAE